MAASSVLIAAEKWAKFAMSMNEEPKVRDAYLRECFMHVLSSKFNSSESKNECELYTKLYALIIALFAPFARRLSECEPYQTLVSHWTLGGKRTLSVGDSEKKINKVKISIIEKLLCFGTKQEYKEMFQLISAETRATLLMSGRMHPIGIKALLCEYLYNILHKPDPETFTLINRYLTSICVIGRSAANIYGEHVWTEPPGECKIMPIGPDMDVDMWLSHGPLSIFFGHTKMMLELITCMRTVVKPRSNIPWAIRVRYQYQTHSNILPYVHLIHGFKKGASHKNILKEHKIDISIPAEAFTRPY